MYCVNWQFAIDLNRFIVIEGDICGRRGGVGEFTGSSRVFCG